MPRSRITEWKRSSVNQRLSFCELYTSLSVEIFFRATSGSMWTKAFGEPKSPSHFGISYSKIRWLRKVFHVSSHTLR